MSQRVQLPQAHALEAGPPVPDRGTPVQPGSRPEKEQTKPALLAEEWTAGSRQGPEKKQKWSVTILQIISCCVNPGEGKDTPAPLHPVADARGSPNLRRTPCVSDGVQGHRRCTIGR